MQIKGGQSLWYLSRVPYSISTCKSRTYYNCQLARKNIYILIIFFSFHEYIFYVINCINYKFLWRSVVARARHWIHIREPGLISSRTKNLARVFPGKTRCGYKIFATYLRNFKGTSTFRWRLGNGFDNSQKKSRNLKNKASVLKAVRNRR